MLPKSFNITDRKPIWMALSEFYLDNELQELDFQYIAKIIKQSPYSFEEVKEIDKNEIFPILKYNLLQVAGEWAGFDENWLFGVITKRLERKPNFNSLGLRISYWMFRWMCKEYWTKLETAYNDL